MDFITIDPLQRKINKLMGISDENFQKYSPKTQAPGYEENDVQRKINKLMGISDEDFQKYSCKTPDSGHEESNEDEIYMIIPKKNF